MKIKENCINAVFVNQFTNVVKCNVCNEGILCSKCLREYIKIIKSKVICL